MAVLPVPAAGQHLVNSRLELALAERSNRGIDLGAGISTSHDGPTECPAAYAEASRAHTGLGGKRGVLALPVLGVLVGGAPPAPRLIEAFEQRFNIRLMDGYGLSEKVSKADLLAPAPK